jgi:hypothetical protein
MERGPNYFAMDNIDGSKKEPTALVNQGFDEQEAAHTPVGRMGKDLHKMLMFCDWLSETKMITVRDSFFRKTFFRKTFYRSSIVLLSFIVIINQPRGWIV